MGDTVIAIGSAIIMRAVGECLFIRSRLVVNSAHIRCWQVDESAIFDHSFVKDTTTVAEKCYGKSVDNHKLSRKSIPRTTT